MKLLGLLGLAFLPSSAAAGQSLEEAIKQLDAKYLDAPDVAGIDNAPKIEAGGGEEATEPTPQEISQGPVKAALTYLESTDEDGNITRNPVVTVFVDDREIAKIETEGPGEEAPPVSLQIAELDPSNVHPEVVVSFFTGGAHCCSDTSVILSNADGTWTTIDVGEFDGGPLLAVDLDGDGRYEFETRDEAFLYTFACYACSQTPLDVLAIEDGKVKNVSDDPRFRPAHEAWLKNMIGNVPEDDVNGFLAGYVGEKIRLGEGKAAWELMLAHYDKESDWGLGICDQDLDENGKCLGKTITLTFPEALELTLKENSYNVEN